MISTTSQQLIRTHGGDAKRDLMFWLFVLMVFLYPVWPGFLEHKLGPLPSLTPQKFLNYVLLGLFLLKMAFSKTFAKRISSYVSQDADIFKPLAWLLFFKFLSCCFSLYPFQSLGLFFYETLTTICVLFIALGVLKKSDDLQTVFTAMLLSAIVIIAYSITEAIVGKNLLEPFIPKQAGLLALMEKTREGVRRVQGPFDSPLVLAEYAVMMLPVILLVPVKRSGFWIKALIFICVVGALAAIYYSRTRTALGAVVLAFLYLLVYGLIKFIRDPQKNQIIKYMVMLYGGIAILAAVGIVIWMIYSLAQGYSIDQVLGISESSRTLYASGDDARWAQLEMAIPVILESPLWGYGVGVGADKVGFVGTDAMITLDSYLLSITADSGIPAMLLITWVMGLCIFKAYQLSRERIGEEPQWALTIVLSLGCVVFFMVVSPMVDLFPLAFILIAAMMVLRTRPTIHNENGERM